MSLSAKEQKILDSIKVASYNDPKNPEFPPNNPKFPATPTYRIDVPGFTNVWFKDESHNPYGTHKDRMAWEMVVTYREFLLAKQRGILKELPQMSIITSGTAGFAIQSYLKKYKLPNLKCLVDSNIDPKIKEQLKKIGAEVYETDLSHKAYTWKEILSITNNENGLDITSSEALNPTLRYYDWLSYEIINNSPEYCFTPFGTGHLYENTLNINKREASRHAHDRRFEGDIETLRNCHFIGATTNNPHSKAEKLYSSHLPFVHFNEQWIRIYRDAGYCGKESNVTLLKEEFLDEAIELGGKLKLNAEPSALAGLAMLLQMKNEIPKNAKILIVSTGKTKWK